MHAERWVLAVGVSGGEGWGWDQPTEGGRRRVRGTKGQRTWAGSVSWERMRFCSWSKAPSIVGSRPVPGTGAPAVVLAPRSITWSGVGLGLGSGLGLELG